MIEINFFSKLNQIIMKTKILSLVIFIIFFSAVSFAQSPYYSIKVSIKKEAGDKHTYEYYHTLCIPPELSTDGDTFDHDTSKLDWQNLSKEFLNSFECRELGSETDSIYVFGNQMMVYENLAKITIVRTGGGTQDTMSMIFPIKIKSFVTFINIRDIPFNNKTYDMTNDMVYSTEGMYLNIKPRDDYEWIPSGK